MKTNFTLLDGDKVLALNRTDLEINLDQPAAGQIVDLGDGRQWRVTGLKEVTYTVELVPEPVVEAPRTFPKDQPALKTANLPTAPAKAIPAPIQPRSTPQVITPTARDNARGR